MVAYISVANTENKNERAHTQCESEKKITTPGNVKDGYKNANKQIAAVWRWLNNRISMRTNGHFYDSNVRRPNESETIW